MYRLEADVKGETGWVTARIDLDYRITAGITMREEEADLFQTEQRAERMASKLAGRFDAVRVVPA